MTATATQTRPTAATLRAIEATVKRLTSAPIVDARITDDGAVRVAFYGLASDDTSALWDAINCALVADHGLWFACNSGPDTWDLGVAGEYSDYVTP